MVETKAKGQGKRERKGKEKQKQRVEGQFDFNSTKAVIRSRDPFGGNQPTKIFSFSSLFSLRERREEEDLTGAEYDEPRIGRRV